ncbi:MAG: phosphatase PAP2 family protein [Verrucomicrobiaceae bacterium]|nr:phosphatase PAP2 family protein [Verrucomicrobiaceae bacterium]
MKKRVRASRVLRLLRRDALQALRHMRAWFSRRWAVVAAGASAALVCIWLAAPMDAVVIAKVRALNESARQWMRVAQMFSYWGDFLGLNLIAFVTLQAAGWARRSRALMRAAAAGLLCAFLAGLTANALRLMTGRPRPSTQMRDRLHGPSLSTKMHALPSAHVATAFGGALPVLLSHPAAGVPLTLCAAAVGWSRLQLDRHHMTDELVSVLIAMLFAVPLSQWARDGRPGDGKTSDFRNRRRP